MNTVTTKAEDRYHYRTDRPEKAARRHARKVHGRRAITMRTTGTAGLSGWFQAYLPCQGSGTTNYTSVGTPFHVA